MPHILPRLPKFILISAAIGALASPVFAQETPQGTGKVCYVSKMKFENEGGYELIDFKVQSYDLNGVLTHGKSRTWDLSKTGVKTGSNVFLTYKMDRGDSFDRKSCQKDGTKLSYHPNGNTWGYWSKGTTKHNNRCRFRSNRCLSLSDVTEQ